MYTVGSEWPVRAGLARARGTRDVGESDNRYLPTLHWRSLHDAVYTAPTEICSGGESSTWRYVIMVCWCCCVVRAMERQVFVVGANVQLGERDSV